MKDVTKISRKDFLRLRFPAASENEISDHDLEKTQETKQLHIDLPPEFRSFYAMQSKALGLEGEELSEQEAEKKMLQALWQKR